MARAALSAERIVATAEALIRDSGSTDWTVRKLCKRLECAPGGLYRFFPGGGAIGAGIRSRHLGELAHFLAGVDHATDDLARSVAPSSPSMPARAAIMPMPPPPMSWSIGRPG